MLKWSELLTSVEFDIVRASSSSSTIWCHDGVVPSFSIFCAPFWQLGLELSVDGLHLFFGWLWVSMVNDHVMFSSHQVVRAAVGSEPVVLDCDKVEVAEVRFIFSEFHVAFGGSSQGLVVEVLHGSLGLELAHHPGLASEVEFESWLWGTGDFVSPGALLVFLSGAWASLSVKEIPWFLDFVPLSDKSVLVNGGHGIAADVWALFKCVHDGWNWSSQKDHGWERVHV